MANVRRVNYKIRNATTSETSETDKTNFLITPQSANSELILPSSLVETKKVFISEKYNKR